MRPRILAGCAVLLIAAALAGCTVPAPTPTPTPTGFADDAAAFAAAEATYRAYVDALNRVDLADPSTFEPVYALTTGEANASDRETFSQMHADSLSKSGNTVVMSFKGGAYDATGMRVEGTACIDVASTELRNATGSIVTNPQRPPRYSLKLSFIVESEPLLSQALRVDDPAC